jgi:TonB family protein
MAVVEGFDTAPHEGTRPDRPARVADAGFGGRTERAATGRIATTVGEAGFAAEPPAHDGAPGPRRIASTGFAEAAAAHPPAPAMPRAAAAPAGFTETPAAGRPAAATPARAQARAYTPVEILYKPTPAYSDEARARGVEGEVSIEVTFTAGGQVRVVRVARGLGYGLDDMARHAAERIRFTPATRGGVPVDVHTTLTIVFRLT